MYIFLGLLWLCFKIIQGEITRCPLGGIRDEHLCKKLNKDTVFYRFYLNGFQRKIIGNKDNKYDVYDKAFEQFKEVSKNRAVNSELNVLDPLDVMRPSKTYPDAFYKQEEILTADDYKQMYRKIIFRQSLILDCDPVDSNFLDPLDEIRLSFKKNFNYQGGPTKIKTLWGETLSIGTDTYRLKFHNKLLSTYQDKQNTLSKEDCMVFIESYYNAASINFFSRMYITALYIIEDGIKFGLSVRDQQFKNDEKNESKVLNSWLWLCEILKQDILIYIKPEMKPKNISNESTSTTDHTSMQPIGVFYSSASVLFYRKYFLDDDLKTHIKESLEKLTTDRYQSFNDTDIIYTQYNLMYNYLLLARFGKTKKVKLDNAIYAIMLPVLSIEDRLLNYKALLITMDMLHLCLDENGLLNMSKVCEPMNELKDNDSFFREIIIPKLKNVYYAMHDDEIIMNLIYNLSTKDAIINERILHVIVISAIDIAELDTIKYIKHIKSAIEILEYFVKVLEEEKEKSENKTEKENKCESKEIGIEDFIINTNEENYTKKTMELLSNLTYSTIDQKTKNLFIAYKWLAELYGALCKNSNNLTEYQKRLNKYILLADKFSKKIDLNDDDHLKYLKNKRDAKILVANNSWEVGSWPGGWYFGNIETETSKILDTSANGEKSNMLNDLNFLKNESKCPYINKIEINILLYRLYVMDSVKNDYKQMYQYLAGAINEVVITSEDRARNMEAHELLSIYLMILNRHAIEKVQTNTGSQNG